MAQTKKDPPASDLPPGVGRPALRAFSAAGYTRLKQFTKVVEADLLKLHGVGPRAIHILRSALEAQGLSFASPAAAARPKPARRAATAGNEVFDSPTGWVRSHIRDYVESDGKKGHRWRGLPTLLLTTRGRRSGKLRRTALIYGRDGTRYLLVASNGGAVGHPAWYLNLVENPQVRLQVGAEKVTAQARTASAREKPRLWKLMVKIFPQYERYQTKTRRDIPVVIVAPD